MFRKDKQKPANDVFWKELMELRQELGKVSAQLLQVKAEGESLELRWASYRDELKRLANRIEKRAQREAEPEPQSPVDHVSEMIRARRRGLTIGGDGAVSRINDIPAKR